MPQQEISHLRQRAVLWNSLGTVDRFGQSKVDNPIEIPCRWNDGYGEALDAQGNSIALDATVVLDRKVLTGSHMWLGTLSQWMGTGVGSGAAVPNYLMEVKTVKATPDVKGRSFMYVVGLIRFKDT